MGAFEDYLKLQEEISKGYISDNGPYSDNSVASWQMDENQLAELKEKQPYTGPSINGVKPMQLIKSGELSSDTITKEQLSILAEDLMLGQAESKEQLSKAIQMLSVDSALITYVLNSQFQLSQFELSKRDNSVGRTLDFLATVYVLQEMGYDLSEVKINSTLTDKQTGTTRLAQVSVADALEQTEQPAREARAMILDPTSFQFRYNPEYSNGEVYADIFARKLAEQVRILENENMKNDSVNNEQNIDATGAPKL